MYLKLNMSTNKILMYSFQTKNKKKTKKGGKEKEGKKEETKEIRFVCFLF